MVGRLNAITRLISVLLPDPRRADERRRRAGRRAERDVLEHRHARVVLEPDVLELDVAAQIVRAAPRVASSASSRGVSRISRMRSSPANASVICVPIDAICTIGIASRPVKKM